MIRTKAEIMTLLRLLLQLSLITMIITRKRVSKSESQEMNQLSILEHMQIQQ